MASKRKSRFAILGLLSWQPMSGYDLKKFVDMGLSHFWNENYGQIYPTLESLVADGLATKREGRAEGSRRTRFLYEITGAGREAFRAWLAEPTGAPIVRNEFELKFFLSTRLPDAEALRLLGEYRTQQMQLLEEYRHSEAVLRAALRDGSLPDELEALLAHEGKSPPSRAKECRTFLLTLRHGVRVVEARVAWCDEAVEVLGQSKGERA